MNQSLLYGGESKGDESKYDVHAYNDGGNPELFDLPALMCGRCGKIASMGGRNFEKNNPSSNVGFCIQILNPDAICNK